MKQIVPLIAVLCTTVLIERVSAQVWIETGDAGSLPIQAQVVEGMGPLNAIDGQTGPGDLQDMYLILIDDPINFEAATDNGAIPGGGATFDTRLWLIAAEFPMPGLGLLANDDCFFGCADFHSHLLPMATDGTNQNIPGPGLYFLAISGFPDEPLAFDGAQDVPMFNFQNFNEVSGPDGPGGPFPMSFWADNNPNNEFGVYTIALQGASFVPAPGCGADIECDDGNLCTVDVCDLETGICENLPLDCDDGDDCTDDFCDPGTGNCQNPPILDCLQEPPHESPPIPSPAAPCGQCGSCEDPELDDSGVMGFSGEFMHSMSVLDIPGRGMDFDFTMTYGAQRGVNSTVGNGWDFAYNAAVLPGCCSSQLKVCDGNSRCDSYVQQLDGTFIAPEYFNVLQINPDLSLTLTFPDTGTWNFSALNGSATEGLLTSIVDRNGITMDFTYDAGGRLDTITDTLGRDIDLTYNADGFVDTITDFVGRTVEYDYYEDGDAGGSAGDLKSVTTPAVQPTAEFPIPAGHAFPNGKTTTFTYTTGFGDERLNHDLLTITDPKGQVYLQNVYAHTIDALDTRFTTDPANTYFDRIVRQIWGNPNDTIDYVYIPVNPEPQNNFAVIQCIENDRVGNVTELFYDQNNREVIRLDFTGRANPDQPTTATDNRPGPPLRPSDPVLWDTHTEYNNDGLRLFILHEEGDRELRVYDELNPDRRSQGNLLTRELQPGPRGGDQPAIIETFEYDDDFGGCCGTNFVTRHVDGRGNETLHTYDANGNREQTTHRIPSIVEDYEYNEFGQQTLHVHPDNGSGCRRVDVFDYYEEVDGVQNGYLKQTIIDATHPQSCGGSHFDLTTVFEYDAAGNVIRTIDPRDHDTLRIYNQLDQVVRETSREVTDGSGIRYERDIYYDANDNVVRVDVENKDDSGALQANTHFTTIYEYEILNYIVLTCEEASDINIAINERDCDNVPPNQFVFTEFEYDANRNQTLERDGEATNGNDPDNVVQSLYDERDLLYQHIRAPGTSAQSTTQTDYDGNRNVIRTSEGVEDAPRVHERVYDGYDRLVEETDPMGNVTEYHFDANHNLGGDQSPGVPHPFAIRMFGELDDVAGSAANVRLSETLRTYDAMDRVVTEREAFFDALTQAPLLDGLADTLTEYSANSQVIRVTDDNAHETFTTYDSANRVLTVTDPKNNVVTYGYDANNNVVTVTELERSDLNSPTDDETFVTTLTYDALDRLTSSTDNVGNVQTHGYDSRDNRVRELDANSHEHRQTYDGLSRVTSSTFDLDADGADGDGPDVVTVQVWDDSSRLIARIDDNDNATRYAYDSLDRMVATRMEDGTIFQIGSGLTAGDWPDGDPAPDFSGFTIGYDVHDNRLIFIDPNGSQNTSIFDLLNRKQQVDVVPGAGVSSATTQEQYDYDGLSRMTRAEDDDDVVLRRYDSLSRVVSETLNGVTTTSTYDGVGNQTNCTYPGGRSVTCTYDALDRKQTVSDAAGTIATYDYIGPLRVERREYGNGTRTDFAYDGVLPNPAGDFGERQIVATTHTRVSDAFVIDSRTYRWDAMYNKTRRSDDRSGGPGLTHDYEYDALYRLTRSTADDPAPGLVDDVTYDFDGVGNRNGVSGGSAPGTYVLDGTMPAPADSQLNQYTSTPLDQRTYDANGNLVGASEVRLYGDVSQSGGVGLEDIVCLIEGFQGNFGSCALDALDLQPCGGGDGTINLDDLLAGVDALFGDPSCSDEIVDIRAITYDAYNRMVEHLDPESGLRTTYTYDATGRRTERTEDADAIDSGPSTTRYYYDEWHVIEEQNADAATQATYVYGQAIDDILNMQRGGIDYYYHCDDMRNVMALTDGNADVVERYEYADYGQALDPATLAPVAGDPSAVGNPYGFTGRRFDPETGWYYFRTRYLDPLSGRFSTRDSLGIWGDLANLGNGYTYAGNNPWTMVDPTGMFSWKCFAMCMLDLDEWTVSALLGAGFGKVLDQIKDGKITKARRTITAILAKLAKKKGKRKLARVIIGIGARLIPGAGQAILVGKLCYCSWKCW